MKNTFKINSISFTIKGHPFEIKGVEFETEANAQELATSGSNINNLVETIGAIAERFDGNHTPVEEIKEIKAEPKEIEVEPKVEPVKVKPQSVNNDFCELPTAIFSGGEPIKKHFNLTKEWRAISIPTEMKKVDPDKYRWLGEQYPIADSVTVDGSTYGVVYIHIEAMHQKSFIIIRPENVKFEDDVKPEEFNEFLETINIPTELKDYIKKVIEL